MNNSDVLTVLQSKGVMAFFHANSVRTSCTFLESGALLSRGYVEKHKLKQTAQASDPLDKKYGIWNDLFLDGVDVHDRSRNKNYYGPVLFVLDLKSVLSDKNLDGTLRITRKNPVHWIDGQKESDRYFETAEEFAASFSFGDFGKHFTFRPEKGRIELDAHLDHILLDDPQNALGDPEAYKVALKALEAAAKAGKVEVEIRKRPCRGQCKCVGNYNAGDKLMFDA